MRIVIDTTPLYNNHAVRGIGRYTANFLKFVKQYDKDNFYQELTLSKKIDFNSFDLLLIPYFSPFSLSLPIRKKIKTLVTIHDLIPLKFSQYFPTGLRGKLIWLIQRKLLKNIDGIITDSFKISKEIQRISGVNKAKIFVVYPAVDDLFQVIKDQTRLQLIRKKYNLPSQFILYVGDCNWNKNVPSLIRACQELNLYLVLVGKVFKETDLDFEHPWNQSLKEVLSLAKNNPKIIRLGYIDDQDLVLIYNLAKFYVQPSYDEGFGLPMVEAFACGCPVLSSNQGSLKEVGGSACFYFNPYQKDDLLKKIQKINSDERFRHSLKKAGLKRVEKYQGSIFVNNLKKVYEKIFKK